MQPIADLNRYITQVFSGQRRDWTMDGIDTSEIAHYQKDTRTKLNDLLCVQTSAHPPIGHKVNEWTFKDSRVEEIHFDGFFGIQNRGLLLLPNTPGPHPVIVALHDHGGYYKHGAEKMLDLPENPDALKTHQQLCYGGRPFGSAAVKRGYAVMAIDAVGFGTRRFFPEMVKEDEAIITKHLISSGLTWAGIALGDDIRTIDYLETRQDIDSSRIGCAGMSFGGFRSAFLSGMDTRVRCAAATCWMTTYAGLMPDKLGRHTFMAHVPGLTRHMDLPDVAVLTLPRPLLLQFCLADDLFTTSGMQQAGARIKAAYEKGDCSDKLKETWFDRGHSFGPDMQDDVLDWFDIHMVR